LGDGYLTGEELRYAQKVRRMEILHNRAMFVFKVFLSIMNCECFIHHSKYNIYYFPDNITNAYFFENSRTNFLGAKLNIKKSGISIDIWDINSEYYYLIANKDFGYGEIYYQYFDPRFSNEKILGNFSKSDLNE